MAAKEVKFSRDARERILKGVDILADVCGQGVHAVFGATQTTGAVKQALVAGPAFEALAKEWRAAQ